MNKGRVFLRSLCLSFLLCGAGIANATKIVIQTPEGFGDDIKAASLVVSTNERDDATAQDMLGAALADYGRITGAFYELGFYGPTVNILLDGREAAEIQPLNAPQDISQVTIRVLPGKRFMFSRTVAEPIAPGTDLPERYAVGKPARSGVIIAAGEAGVSGWRNVGYAKAKIAEETFTANHAASELSSVIRFAPGPKLRFGRLNILNDSAVRAERIREIAGLPTGEVYSPDELERASERLRDAGAFRSIALRDAERANPDGTLDINANIVDEKPRRFGAGIELYSEEGVSLTSYWMHRNLLGGAERLRIEGSVSGIGGNSGGEDYRGIIRFERPATFDPDTDLVLEAKYEDLDEPNYKQRNVVLGAGIQHYFSEELTGEIGIGYRYSKIDDDLGKRKTRHLLIPARLTWDTRNDEFNATEGHLIDVSSTPFMSVDTVGFGNRVKLDARKYYATNESGNLVFAGRLQFGSVMGADRRDIPPDMLFFSGGSGTVRGQKYQSLGVDVPGYDDDLGGRSFVGLSGEARVRIKKQYGAVGFVDAGFIGEDAFGGGRNDWHGGAGLGFRYHTGIGPIRVDVATPLDDKAGKRYELYIGIGQAF